MYSRMLRVLSLIALSALVMGACAPVVVEKEVPVEKVVKETVIVEKEKVVTSE